MSEHDFFQIPATGVQEPDREADARTDKSVPIRRALDEKLSNFGAGNVGARMSSDLTRTDLTFQSKDELADRETITEDSGIGSNVAARGTNVDYNPYLAGSTIKKVRDEQAFRMGMSDNRGKSVDVISSDVSDTNETTGTTAGKNWPTEGWRSYGGKYDFPYQGGGIH